MKSELNADTESQTQLRTVFISVVFLSLILWYLYRGLFAFPVIFDETIGKLIFFGLPVWIYATITHKNQILESLSPSKLFPGLLRGLVFGGLFGFTAIILAALNHGGPIIAVPLFVADRFWLELLQAALTAFWESLFFFGFVQTALTNFFSHLTLGKRLLMVALIFLVFHMPNIVLRFSGVAVAVQILLLFAFALGQSLLFEKSKNIYLLIMTHTIWGLVLLLHF
jgi:membrane protease YdiL (CAAX protease family)